MGASLHYRWLSERLVSHAPWLYLRKSLLFCIKAVFAFRDAPSAGRGIRCLYGDVLRAIAYGRRL